uniref:Uncharacterized protein n=1 Tax=Arundo donax TaxID=35708 RepID=A0A0A9E358_ARUDO
MHLFPMVEVNSIHDILPIFCYLPYCAPQKMPSHVWSNNYSFSFIIQKVIL